MNRYLLKLRKTLHWITAFLFVAVYFTGEHMEDALEKSLSLDLGGSIHLYGGIMIMCMVIIRYLVSLRVTPVMFDTQRIKTYLEKKRYLMATDFILYPNMS